MKEGYKKTELGWIPQEWKVETVDALINNNVILEVLDGNHGALHPKASDYVEDGIPFIMANNISKGTVDVKGCKNISEEQSEILKKGFAKEGDVLLTHKGTIGQTAIVPKLKTKYIVLTPQVTYYRLKQNNLYLINDYLKYFFDSSMYQTNIKKIASQSTRDYVGITEQKKLNIILPSLLEQKNIADILGVVDSQIYDTDKLIEKTKELKKGLMQRLLTKGIGHSEFKKSEVGEIPVEWHVDNIGSICNLINGRAFKPKEWMESGIPIIRIQNLNGSDEYNYYDGEIDEKYMIKNGDLLFSWSGSRGTSFGPHIWCKIDGVLNQHIFRVDLKEGLDKRFIYYSLKNITMKIEQEAHGSAGLVHITKGALEKINISLPIIEEQEKIANILSSVDNQIEEFEIKKEKLKEVKKGLMQQLLTGKIRVK